MRRAAFRLKRWLRRLVCLHFDGRPMRNKENAQYADWSTIECVACRKRWLFKDWTDFHD